MKGIEAILFDLDDTLLDRSSTFSLYCDLVIETLLMPYISMPDRQLIKQFMVSHDKNGYESRTDFYRKLTQQWQTPYSAEDLERHWYDNFAKFAVPESNLIETLDYLSTKYKLGIVTNGGSSMQRSKIEALGIEKYFQAIVISGEVNMQKPDIAIYLLACEKIGVEPPKVLFVGDHYQNDVAGAARAGLKAIWINKFAGSEAYRHTVGKLSEIRPLL
ncbi:MAG: HAD-IA family hydrolase [Oscillospiraceae bacterium]|nr:HAD-IA family hydrolase [Oscillospiraceae bacterium]